MGHLLSGSGSSKETIAPKILGGLLGVWDLRVVAGGLLRPGLVAELSRSLLTAPQATWSSCNGSRSEDTS